MNKKFIGQAKLIKDADNDPSDALAQNIAQKAMAGKAQLSAPFLSIDQHWTNEKKEELVKVLAKYTQV